MLNNRLLDTRYFSGRITKFYISIAGVSCSIISHDTNFLEKLLERYQQFKSTGPAEYEIMVHYLSPDAFLRENLTSSPPVKKVNSGNNYLIKLANQPFMAVANTASKKVLVKMRPSQNCFDSFFQILFTLILAEKGGLMLHACANQ